MKKILEVLQYGDHDFRFDTDFDAEKDEELIPLIAIKLLVAMRTTLWGGNETSVLAMIRLLSIADLAASINRKDMVKWLDKASKEILDCFNEGKRKMEAEGYQIQTFMPGINPLGKRS